MINSFLLFISNLLFSMDVDDMEDFFDEIEVGQIIGIVFAIIAVVAVIVFIIKFAKKSKKQTDGLIEEVKDKMQEKIVKEKTKDICEYCGTRLKETDDRCPNCGAQRKK